MRRKRKRKRKKRLAEHRRRMGKREKWRERERECPSFYSFRHLLGKTYASWTQLRRPGWEKVQFPSAVAVYYKALWTKHVVDRLESLGSNNHNSTSSCFTQDDFSSCFSAWSLSSLTELHCFTLEGYKWGGILRTYLSLRA